MTFTRTNTQATNKYNDQWKLNYDQYLKYLRNKSFRAFVGHAKIVEHFLADKKPLHFVTWDAVTKTGTNKAQREKFFDLNPYAVAINVVFSWENEKTNNLDGFVLDYQMDHPRFLDQFNYLCGNNFYKWEDARNYDPKFDYFK